MIKPGLLIPMVLWAWILLSANDSLVIDPPRLVVEYGSRAWANCSTRSTPEGLGWQSSEGAVGLTKGVRFLTWTVEELTDWDLKPICYANFEEHQETVELPVTVYKLPDSVSISLMNEMEVYMDMFVYILKCEIKNVAPAQGLNVTFYDQGKLDSHYEINETSRTPVNISSLFLAVIMRDDDDDDDDRGTYHCEATLDLGPDGPQPPPTVTSDPLRITMPYGPEFSNHTEIIVGDMNTVLNCTVMADPAPTYTWHLGRRYLNHRSSVYSSSSLRSGNYTCTATNALGSDKKLFIVQEKNGAPPGVGVLNLLAVLASALSVLVMG